MADFQMTPNEAFDYISNLLPDFQRKGETLYAQLHAANVLRAQVRSAGLDDSEISTVYNEIQSDLNRWTTITNQLQPFLTLFGYTGLGLGPAIPIAIVSIAALMVAFYSLHRIDQHSEAIKRIATYVNLTPEDQTVIDEATTTSIFNLGSLGNISKYLLIGGAVYLAILMFRR
jgi:hypothetical protein